MRFMIPKGFTPEMGIKLFGIMEITQGWRSGAGRVAAGRQVAMGPPPRVAESKSPVPSGVPPPGPSR